MLGHLKLSQRAAPSQCPCKFSLTSRRNAMNTSATRLSKTSLSPARTPPWTAPAWTMAERLERIAALGQRVEGYVRFMCDIAAFGGASDEAKERAVTAFYEKMITVERQLGCIQEHL